MRNGADRGVAPHGGARPNILIVIAGRMGAAVFPDGPMDGLHMPHLRRLMAGGLRFTRAYAPSPDDDAGRAAILTGRMPLRSGVFAAGAKLGLRQPTFGHVLRLAGYDTVLAGNAVPLWAEADGGFDLRLRADGPAHGLYHDDHAIDLATRYLATRGDGGPWCLTVALQQPQPPFSARRRERLLYTDGSAPPADSPATADEQAHFAALSWLDDRIGRLIATLGPRLAQTVVCVVGSSGLPARHKGGMAPPGPTGAPPDLTEDALHVPMALYLPGHRGQAVTAPVSTLDLFPALARLAGQGVVAGRDATELCDGIDLLQTAGDRLRPPLAAESVANGLFQGRLIAGVWSFANSFGAAGWGNPVLLADHHAPDSAHPELARVMRYFQDCADQLWPETRIKDLLWEEAQITPFIARSPLATPAPPPALAPPPARPNHNPVAFPASVLCHLG